MLKSLGSKARRFSAAKLPRLAKELQRRVLPSKAEPPPSAIIDASLPYGIAIDRFLRVSPERVVLVGWIFDAGGRIESVQVSQGQGRAFDLLRAAHRLSRPDVDAVFKDRWPTAVPGHHGFLCLLPLPESVTPLRIELRLSSGKRILLRAPVLETNRDDAKSLVLEALVAANRPGRESLLRELGSALAELQASPGPGSAVAGVETFGHVPDAPDVSIVIPQYQRLDLLEPQMAAMASDPSLRNCEILHIVDSPWNHEAFVQKASQLSQLFGLPCKVVELRENLGFAGATNAGAHLARGRNLLLLNSDVIPKERGWMGALQRAHGAHENIGALGCKLLYENDTIQHAGMEFRKERVPPYHWLVYHPFKGLHERTPAAALDRPVPAITGACLMVERDLYWKVGGLSSDYLLGDFEDSDLCLRLLEAGRTNWYTASATLYHLEGQSYSFDARRAAITRHNALVHHERWSTLIESLPEDRGSNELVPATAMT